MGLGVAPSCFTRYLEPPEGFEGLTGDELYEAQAGSKRQLKQLVFLNPFVGQRMNCSGEIQDQNVGKHSFSGTAYPTWDARALVELELHVKQIQEDRS